MITEHQLFHLNAVLAEANETKNLKSEDKDKWMKNKKVKEGKEDEYLDKIIKDVEKIKKDEVFPELECASAIHDYLEKDTKESFKNG
jgi:hypothetical protein